MPIIRTHETDFNTLRGITREQVYNGLDCGITFEVFEKVSSLQNQPPAIYNFVRAMQAPALEMMLRGWPVDEYSRQKGIATLRADIARLEAGLAVMAEAVWDKPLNPRSRPQMLAFFYGVKEDKDSKQIIPIDGPSLRLPRVWSSKKGKKSLSMDREALEKLEAYFFAMPIIATILAIRELSKQREMLLTEVDSDGRMRTSYNIVGAETGRWCLAGDTEVLTREGWIAIADWSETSEIACWWPNKTVHFAKCKKLQYNNAAPLIKIANSRLNVLCTKEHKTPYFTSKRHFSWTYAGDRKSMTAVPLGGVLLDNFLPEEHTRVCVMMQADGTILNSKSIRFHFKKDRKIWRCEDLLIKAELEYTVSKSPDGTTYFYVKEPPIWLFAAKTFGPWLLQHNPNIVLDEIPYWDGDLDKNGATIFYSSVKSNAEWIKTVAHLTGRFASLRVKRTASAAWNTAYRVYIGMDSTTRINPADYSDASAVSTVYCAETVSGFFLIRRNGEISVTGNSSSANAWGTGGNLQNINPVLRHVFTCLPGWKICGIDLEQAESREVGLLLGMLFNDWSYLDACERGDLHTTTAKLIWPALCAEQDIYNEEKKLVCAKGTTWGEDKKVNRALADQPFYRHFSYRDMSKRGGHGTTYFGTPFTMARHLKVPVKFMEDFQRRFLGDAFPGISKWHRWVAEQLQTHQRLTTPFGFTRHFFGRPNDDSTLREAIAFSPQSSTAYRTNLGLWRIWKHMGKRVQVLHQNHDAVYFMYREEDEAWAVPQALKLMEIETWEAGRKFVVPGEAKIGWNWGSHHREDKPIDAENPFNPNGLIKWKGPGADKRRRLVGAERPV